MDEFSRKLIHLCGLAVPLIYRVLGREDASIFFGCLFVLAVAGEIARRRLSWLNAFFLSYASDVAREREREKILGSTYFACSAFLSIFIFPLPIAVSCILYLIVGDTAAALVGTRFGRHRFRDKSLEGSIAFFAVSFLSSLAFIGVLPSLVGALVAAVVEAYSRRDNLTIPLVSGAALFLTSLLFSF